jgi:hypothetical protein
MVYEESSLMNQVNAESRKAVAEADLVRAKVDYVKAQTRLLTAQADQIYVGITMLSKLDSEVAVKDLLSSILGGDDQDGQPRSKEGGYV